MRRVHKIHHLKAIPSMQRNMEILCTCGIIINLYSLRPGNRHTIHCLQNIVSTPLATRGGRADAILLTQALVTWFGRYGSDQTGQLTMSAPSGYWHKVYYVYTDMVNTWETTKEILTLLWLDTT